MSNEVVVFDEIEKIGSAMVQSGYFKDAASEAQAIVKILAGHEIGLGAFASMTGIHIIQGKPELGANVLAALIKNDTRYNYRVEKITDDECILSFFENGEKVGESSFSQSDAKRAGTKNMAKFPRNMLFARAMSNGAKWHVPGIFGGVPVYSQGEISGDPTPTDEQSKILDGSFAEPAPDIDIRLGYLAGGKPETDPLWLEFPPETIEAVINNGHTKNAFSFNGAAKKSTQLRVTMHANTVVRWFEIYRMEKLSNGGDTDAAVAVADKKLAAAEELAAKTK